MTDGRLTGTLLVRGYQSGPLVPPNLPAPRPRPGAASQSGGGGLYGR
jgi:hypothetical protein